MTRTEKALAYLEAVLDDANATRAEKLTAAKAIVAKDAREAANLSTASADKQDRVVRLEINAIPSPEPEPEERPAMKGCRP
jgi:hypothetical protein